MPEVEKLLALKEWARGEQDKADAGLPSEWNQENWFTRNSCGTACCLAGRQALLEGWKPEWWVPNSDNTAGVVKGGEYSAAHQVAREALGLTAQQASALFDAGNTLKEVEEIIDRIVQGTFDYRSWVAEADR